MRQSPATAINDHEANDHEAKGLMHQAKQHLRLDEATSYDEWRDAALAHDERSGAAAWRARDRSDRYDYKVIRYRLEELRRVRNSRDPHQLVFYFNEGIHGNMGGIGAPAMYRRTKFGTKDLITQYIDELATGLRQIANIDHRTLPRAKKVELFNRTAQCFGRSALMLSGGGSLGPFHLGVIQALIEQDLLPNVISGASAGSIVAALIATRGGESLESDLDSAAIAQTMDELTASSDKGSRISIDNLRQFIEAQIPDMTFAEAFEASGVRLNISISPRELHQRSRLMNAITSPNVFIRETVLASCAIPGVFPPVTLAARNSAGKRQSYIPSRQWVDGSVMDDLPSRRLTRLYGVNHFITSQTNPVVLWALVDSQAQDGLFARLWEIGQNASKDLLRATYPLAMQVTQGVYPLSLMTRIAYGVATQDYTADINILPRQRFFRPSKLLGVLSQTEIDELVQEGKTATWPKIEMIRNCTKISRTIDTLLAELEKKT